MARIRVIHDIDDLANDIRGVIKKAPRELTGVVRDGVRYGANVARANARQTAGKHGKHYPRSITSSMNRGGGLFGATYSGEYGPDPGLPQGRMSFEFGSRNQPPHLDLAKSADVVGPIFARSVHETVGELFW